MDSTEYINFITNLYGYGFPLFIISALVTNIFTVMVLMQARMKTPTTVVLTGITLCNIISVLLPAPWTIYMYTFGNYYIPVWACSIWGYTTDMIPAILHSASIWLTVILAVQRYIYLCKASMANKWYANTTAARISIFVIFSAFFLYMPQYFDHYYSSITNSQGQICQFTISDWLWNLEKQNNYNYDYFRFIYAILFFHLIPFVILVTLNIILLKNVNTIEINNEQACSSLKKYDLSENGVQRYINTTIIVIISLVICIELPTIIIKFLTFRFFDRSLDPSIFNVISHILYLLRTISYSVNFVVLFWIHKIFRQTCKDVLFCHNNDTLIQCICFASPCCE